MVSSAKLKSVDFYRKIPRDLTEASLSGAGLSVIAALSMMFLFGMEFCDYLKMSSSTTVIVDKGSDGEFIRMHFNVSFPALSCEFASVDVSDVLGTNRLNITKSVRKFSIDSKLRATGSQFHSDPVLDAIKHDEEDDQEYGEGAVPLNGHIFYKMTHLFPILVVNFYAPWCYWSNRLKPSWEKAATIIRERYDPEMDGRILLTKVDCTEEVELCRRNHIQGYPSIRIFRKGSDDIDDHGHHDHESYYGDRDTESLVKAMEELVAPISLESQKVDADNNSVSLKDAFKRPAPSSGGCRVEGGVRVKKVPGSLIISARSHSHSFDVSQMNMSHVITHLSFGRVVTLRDRSDIKRIRPYLGLSYGRLSDSSFMSNPSNSDANVTVEHYIQVVKTEVATRSHKLLEEYEYTSHSSLIHSLDIPAAKFHYEFSPMQVLVTENSKSLSHFITNVCAIIGGVFTVAGILDSILHNTMKAIKKVELGKNF
ncbi:hypothetical protein Leryth_005930 [Lithospermum erythrorhizon]|nr:hypothetical protein Leryth_005930 [Lithospermum erythrorhizon]